MCLMCKPTMGEKSTLKNGDSEMKSLLMFDKEDKIEENKPTKSLPRSPPQTILHEFLRKKKCKCNESPTQLSSFGREALIPNWIRKLFHRHKYTPAE